MNLNADLVQLVILLAQGLWALVLWWFATINRRLSEIEQTLNTHHLEVVRDYTPQAEHDRLRDQLLDMRGTMQTLRAYDILRKHGAIDKEEK